MWRRTGHMFIVPKMPKYVMLDYVRSLFGKLYQPLWVWLYSSHFVSISIAMCLFWVSSNSAMDLVLWKSSPPHVFFHVSLGVLVWVCMGFRDCSLLSAIVSIFHKQCCMGDENSFEDRIFFEEEFEQDETTRKQNGRSETKHAAVYSPSTCGLWGAECWWNRWAITLFFTSN